MRKVVAGLMTALFLSFVVLPDAAFAAYNNDAPDITVERDNSMEIFGSILLIGTIVWMISSVNKDENELLSARYIKPFHHRSKSKNQLLDIRFNLGLRTLNNPMTISNGQYNVQQFVPRLEISVLRWK